MRTPSLRVLAAWRWMSIGFAGVIGAAAALTLTTGNIGLIAVMLVSFAISATNAIAVNRAAATLRRRRSRLDAGR